MGNKTRLQMRTDLAIDLKITIDTELSVAELNRSIERSVADFNRYLPDEKIYENSLQFAVTGESVTFPIDAVSGQIVAVESLANTVVAGSLATIDGQPDVPRPLRYLLTDADNSIQGMTLIVEGIDKDDQALQEVSHYTIGDDKLWMGKEYFKAVYSVEFDQITGNASPDQIEIGIGAYTDVWVYLANSPIKWGSESATDDASEAITRNTDFYVDYANGRVKAISSGDISAGEVCTFAYSKSQIGIDLSDLLGLIRVQRVEYPVGSIPQVFVQGDTFGKYYVVTGMGESEEQQPMAEDKQYRIYYDAVHQPPTEYAPGTIPTFLENTVLTMAGAYALYILALKQEHQTATDLASARTALGNATGTHSALGVALTNLKKYLADNSTADAKTSLASANGDHSAFAIALTNLKKYLDDNSSAEAATSLASANTDHSAFGIALDNLKKYLDNNSNADAKTSLASANGDHSAFALILADIEKYLDDNSGADAAGVMGSATSDHSTFATALTNLKKYLDNNSGSDAKTTLIDANNAHSAFATALTSLKKYLDNNNTTDAAGLLDDINNDSEALKGLMETALAAANAFLDEVATDLGNANDARANYMGATANYVDGGAAPDIKKYLDDGDALLNAVATGGEGQDVPRAYREYAQAVKDALVAAHEQDRRFYQQNATARTNAAMVFANEAAQHLSFLRSFIERSAGYTAIANTFATEAGHRASDIMAYLRQAEGYVAVANTFAREAEARAAGIDAYLRQVEDYVAISGTFAREAEVRVAGIRTYLEQAEGYVAVANAFAREAEARAAGIRTYLEQAEGYVAVANTFGREAEARVASMDAYLRQAEGYVAVANTFGREAESRLAQINSYLQQAVQHTGAATSDMALADRFRLEANERRNEVYSIWRDRKQYIGDFTAGSVRQMPSYD